MPEHTDYSEDDLFNPETRHEERDVPVRSLWRAMIGFVIFAIISHIILWFLYKGFVALERNQPEAPLTEVARPVDADVPQNQPLLQPFPKVDQNGVPVLPQQNTPRSDLREMRRQENEVLHNYGWVSRDNGVVHMPIEKAKAIMAARLAQQRPATPVQEPSTSPATPIGVEEAAGTVPARGATTDDAAPGAPSAPAATATGGATQ